METKREELSEDILSQNFLEQRNGRNPQNQNSVFFYPNKFNYKTGFGGPCCDATSGRLRQEVSYKFGLHSESFLHKTLSTYKQKARPQKNSRVLKTEKLLEAVGGTREKVQLFNALFSCTGPEFNSKHLHGNSQPPTAPVPRTQSPFLISLATSHAHGMRTNIQAEYSFA